MRKRRSVFGKSELVLFLACCAVLAAGCRREETPLPVGSSETPSPVAPETITTKSGIVMVKVPPGEFTMGDAAGNDDEKPAHNVRVDGFLMDACEVTQESYQRITGKNPSKSKGPDKPVEQVSWYKAAVLYCNMRSARDELEPCYDAETGECNFEASGYRLPTEAEWEYACRAGTNSKYSFGNSLSKLKAHAWFADNSSKTTQPVGQKQPNPWGLYDMHGNVSEWCNDFYAEDYYKQSPNRDPKGPPKGRERVLRGGAWNSSADSCRSTYRASDPSINDTCLADDSIGFRCVRSAPANISSEPNADE